MAAAWAQYPPPLQIKGPELPVVSLSLWAPGEERFPNLTTLTAS